METTFGQNVLTSQPNSELPCPFPWKTEWLTQKKKYYMGMMVELRYL